MISVLREWNEIGNACAVFAREGLPRHPTCEKTWDLFHLWRIMRDVPRTADIIDFGCGQLAAVKLLHKMGFERVVGVDLEIPVTARASQFKRMWQAKSLAPPFRLKRMNIEQLSFSAQTFDVGVALSTIEHGVDIDRFFAEAARVLRRDAVLYVSTDYWFSGMAVDSSFRAFGAPWRILSDADIHALLVTAAKRNFILADPSLGDLACGDPCVVWGGKEYTFIAMVFRRTGR